MAVAGKAASPTPGTRTESGDFKANKDFTDMIENKIEVSPSVQIKNDHPRLSFKYESLLDACYLMDMLDVEENNLRKCPECFRTWRSTNTSENRSYCPDSYSSPNQATCSQRANQRKSRQRKSWLDFLDEHKPEIGKKWRNYDAGTADVPHPCDRQESLSSEEQELAKKWAKRTRKYSDRELPDQWLEPLLPEEE